MRNFLFPLVVIILMLCFSCENSALPDSSGSLTVIAYNVQCFFDDVDDGNEYSAYKRVNGWSSAKYEARIERLSNTLKRSEYSEADIIFFEELESSKVLTDLLYAGLRRRGYVYYGILGENLPISVGFISKIEPQYITLHMTGEQRGILCVELVKDGVQFFIFNLHAKSNLGTEEENKALRSEMARHLNDLAYERRVSNVIILGDFNTDVSLTVDDMLCYADAVDEEEIIASSSIPIARTRGRVGALSFYDPSVDMSLPIVTEGSYWYQGVWHFYDKILLNSSLMNILQSYEFSVLSDYPATSELTPYGYNVDTGLGYSDHFAVKLKMSY